MPGVGKVICLQLELGNIFHQRTNKKISFGLLNSHGLNSAMLLHSKVAMDNMCINESGCVPVKLYLLKTSGGPNLAHGLYVVWQTHVLIMERGENSSVFVLCVSGLISRCLASIPPPIIQFLVQSTTGLWRLWRWCLSSLITPSQNLVANHRREN